MILGPNDPRARRKEDGFTGSTMGDFDKFLDTEQGQALLDAIFPPYAVLNASDTDFVELAAVMAMAENDARAQGSMVEITVNHDDDTVTFRLVDIEPSDEEVTQAWEDTLWDMTRRD